MYLSGREKVLLTAAAVLAIIFGFNRFFLQPVHQRIQANQDRIRSMQDRIKMAGMEKRLQEVRACRAVRLQKTDQALDVMIPHENSGTGVLELIDQWAFQHGLTLSSLAEDWTETQDVKDSEGVLKSYSIICEAAGQYPDIKAFLKDIENQPRLIIVEKLTIENDPVDQSRAKFELRIYYDP